MNQPTDPAPAHQTDDTDPPPCPCVNTDHRGVRIGERISPSGAGLGGLYVCPAESTTGLKGTL